MTLAYHFISDFSHFQCANVACQIVIAEGRAFRTLKTDPMLLLDLGSPKMCRAKERPASPDRNKKHFTYKIELAMNSENIVLPFNLRTLFCSQQSVTWALTVRAVDYAGNSGRFSFPQFMQGMSPLFLNWCFHKKF